jgi:sortase (surface protein transpeptidase)
MKLFRLQTSKVFLRSHLHKVRSGLAGVQVKLVVKPVVTQNTQKKPSFMNQLWGGLLSGVVLTSILVIAAMFGPDLFYRIKAIETKELIATQETSPLGGDFGKEAQLAQSQQAFTYQPPRNESLPEGRWLSIPRIGVLTQLQENEDPDKALEIGVWMVPGYGKPGDKTQPMILAAHRYGWDWWWKDEYWKYHSFYLLPELEPGDTVEIIDDKRKWVYEVYAGEEGQEITDYQADLIMYTCKFLNSPVRHFRYARLVDPTKDTQAMNKAATESSQLQEKKEAGQSGVVEK